jgi:hypothetical protein
MQILQLLHLLTLHERRHELDAVFVIKLFGPSKLRPSYMDIFGLRVPTWNLRNVLLFTVNLKFKPVPPPDAPMLKIECRNFYIFRRQMITLIFDIVFGLHSIVYQ